MTHTALMEMVLLNNRSAIECWDRGFARNARPLPPGEEISCLGTVRELKRFASAIPPLSEPVCILANRPEKRNKSAAWKCQTWSRPFPSDAVYQLNDEGVCLASPWFCYCQMAAKLGFVRAIQLGMELCGGYSTLPFSGSFASSYRVTPREKGNGFVERNPLTTASALGEAVRAAFPAGTRSIAVQAARYIADNARSPAEARLYLLLRLPLRHGGFALPPPVLNAKIAIPPELQEVAGSGYYLCDEYYSQYRLAIEYDGSCHLPNGQRANDSFREMVLGSLGIRVIRIDKRQLGDSQAMEMRAGEIAAALGRTLRREARGEGAARARLRRQVLDWESELY